MGMGDVYTMSKKISSDWPKGIRVRSTTSSIRDIVTNYIEGTYRMSDLQRGDTYTEKQRNELVASVLQRIPIGEITLMRNADEGFDILDGGHRIRTLRAFYSGEFAFYSPDRRNAFLMQFDGKKLSEFSKKDAQRFLNTDVSVTKLDPDELSADGVRRCASNVLLRKLVPGVSATAGTRAVVRQGALDQNVGRVLQFVRSYVRSEVIQIATTWNPGNADLNSACGRAERAIAQPVSVLVRGLSIAGILRDFSEDTFRNSAALQFNVGFCAGTPSDVSRATGMLLMRVGFACIRGLEDVTSFVRRVKRVDEECRRTHSAAAYVRPQSIIQAMKLLLLTEEAIDADLREMLSGLTREQARKSLEYCPAAYRKRYRELRDAGEI